MFSRSIAHCSRQHTCVKEEHGIRGLNEIDRLSARTYILLPPQLPKLFLHAAARSFSIYYRGNESRELLDFCPAPPMKFTPACFYPSSSFSFQRSNPRNIRGYPRLRSGNIAVDRCVTFCFEWFFFFFFFFYTTRKRFRDMTVLRSCRILTKFDFYPLPRLSLNLRVKLLCF